MTASVHPTAVIGAQVILEEGVQVGAYCVLEGQCRIGAGTVLHSHVAIAGHTTIGAACQIYPFASIGHAPQDLKYAGEPSRVEIGDYTVIREHVTINPGTTGGGMLTRVGQHCLMMVGCHVAHDCQVGNHVIMANNATLAGHVTVGDYAVLGGLSAVHQFVRIGEQAMIGGMTPVEGDVVPYATVLSPRGRLAGLNVVGMRRRGLSKQEMHQIRAALRLLFSEGTIADNISKVQEQWPDSPAVQAIAAFLAADSSRALCRPEHRDIFGGV